MHDPHAALRDVVLASIRTGPGQSDPALRQAVASQTGVPRNLEALIAKVHAHAYRVTDADIKDAQGHYNDEQLFEIVVNAAVGASEHRLRKGLAALEQA